MNEARFLVVDDDETFTAVLARSLRRRGFEVDIAGNGARARDYCQRIRYDFASVDLRMDDENGLALIPALRASNPAMRILVLTGYASIATTVEAMKRGADNYLPKPANASEILKALDEDPARTGPVDTDEPMSIRRQEWETIQRVLAEHDGNISATARALGMHRRTLQRKLDKYPVRR